MLKCFRAAKRIQSLNKPKDVAEEKPKKGKQLTFAQSGQRMI